MIKEKQLNLKYKQTYYLIGNKKTRKKINKKKIIF